MLKNVKNSTDNVFVLKIDDRSLIPEIPNVGMSPKEYVIQNISTKDFIQATPSLTGFYLYYFGELESWTWMKKDLQVGMLTFKPDGSPYDSSTQIFMGHSGVIAQTHHDRSHNFFVQIYGRKRFLLFPPSEWEGLYLYPYLHPHYQQSQVEWENPDFDKFPKFSNVTVYEAFLNPGDLLYIPRKRRLSFNCLLTSLLVSSC